MRFTASPVERLRSLLTSLAAVAGSPDHLLVRARAIKVRHLCRQIDHEACSAPFGPPLTHAEACQIIEMAESFLAQPKIAERPPIGLIYCIHACAIALSEAGGLTDATSRHDAQAAGACGEPSPAVRG